MRSTNELMAELLNDIDAVTTGAVRFFANRTSRRSFLGRLGAVATGVGAFPLLPMARDSGPAMDLGASAVREVDASSPSSAEPLPETESLQAVAAESPIEVPAENSVEKVIPEMGDEQSCDYWRYCAYSGQICSCCGGSMTQCPAGAETASVAWIGTCHNPTDGKDYLVSYNDCCGKASCGRCGCHRSEGDRPVYFPPKSNSILWCFGSKSHTYHCTLARVVGEASADIPA